MKVFLLVMILNLESKMSGYEKFYNIPSRSECEHHGKRLAQKSHYKDFYCMEVFRNVKNLKTEIKDDLPINEE